MHPLFKAVNAVCDKLQVVSNLFWDFPTNFDWYANIPILGNFSLAIILLIGSGIFFTCQLRFIQVRKFKYGLHVLKTQKAKTGISPLASFLLSTAMRVGPGNILGVTGAISIGGPGALFWMWFSAFFGMATAFTESTLSQIFKEKKDDEYIGGLPFYGSRLLKGAAWVGVALSLLYILYALLCLPAQGFNTISAVVSMASILTGTEIAAGAPIYWITFAILIVLVAFVAFGGTKKVAKVTDVIVLVVAADDGVMPQTIEAINHAQAAGVPMVFAINKIDKPNANPDHIKEQLAQMNYLVESWGGKYQDQEISAKKGINLDKLLEKVLLEAELLDLKANPNKKAVGTVIESTLDKGRGYVATVLVQNGTLHIGDVVLSGTYTGRVKAMFNENGKKVTEAGPSTPVQVLGLNGAPQAGDTFNVMDDDRSAREIANKREQLQRMQGIMTQKHVTLDEIGRRIAIGSFKELNIIVKGDVDGSIEAMSGSLIKLSKESVQVNVIHAAVGQISESDVLLAAASNAIIVGFQVRPSAAARKLAEKEEIEIRLYSIIYDAINDIKDAIEGMLEPVMKEEIVASVEVMEIFKISKVGTVAGCIVREGRLTRTTPIRVIRDGIVIYTGKLGSLKRFKDDVKEVTMGQDCGLNIESFNDVRVGDIVEGYEQVEVKRK